jgi:hypothetical protein
VTERLHSAGRIFFETAVWAMKNAGYSQEETAEWPGVTGTEADKKRAGKQEGTGNADTL